MAYAARWYEFAAAAIRTSAPAWVQELERRARSRVEGSPATEALWKARQQELLARGPGDGIVRNPERAFEKALEIDPESFEAWLHLGRIRMNRSDPKPAVDALRKAMGSPERRVRYLASMFLGAIAERTADFAQAEERYREASVTYPWAQSPALALAHLLSRTAREVEARTTLAAQFARSQRMVVDPLWTYYLAPDELLDATLCELRAEVMR
jgi:Tfp pilus assembly protein PilF